ncbi:DUF4349 domain-containing protein [Acetivibrio cellulolyticus]|uniref:DUF4349 domain-containing protein n=1 Tax=Acetivibrio cellulolyticus TaxID=35830 RepID=UPI0001E2E79D|nr:DUF4349 domain-containing protein [Acetivibrio cellulolyticus]
MKRNILKCFSTLLGLLLLISMVGCSSNEKNANIKAEAPYEDTNVKREFSKESDLSVELGKNTKADGEQSNASTADTNNSTAFTGTGETSKAVNNSILSQRKIIRNANITVEVDNFDAAYGKIEFIIGNVGYVQESKINKVKQYVDNKEFLVTNGVIIVRVDADKFNTVLKDIKGLGLLTDENIKTDDVTEQFFDVESRLRLLRYEESRLEEYLKKIQDPDTIFKTESRLTEIRHEIEQLTGTLNKLSDLVKLSTITINMNEKLPQSLSHTKTSYFSQLKNNFLGSLSGVVAFLANVLMFIAAAFPVLFFLAIVFFAGYFIYKRFFRSKIKKSKQVSSTEKNDIET